MSHITKVMGMDITDIAAMRAAVAGLQARGINCELLTGGAPRMYGSSRGPECDYVLNLKGGAYDVGFQKQDDGTYSPVCDFYAGHVAGQLGADVNVCPMPSSAEGKSQHQMGKFMQEYAKAIAVNKAVQSGYSVESSTVDEDGNVQVVLAGM